MRCKLTSAILAGGLTIAVSAALADEPFLLSDRAMDSVSAGATAIAQGAAAAIGDLAAETVTESAVEAVAGALAHAQNDTTALAASTLFDAEAAAESSSAASLP